MSLIFWFGLFFFIFLWGFLIYRIIVLNKMGIKPLPISTKNGFKNSLSTIGFVGLVLTYTIIFILNSIIELSYLLFNYFWQIEDFIWVTYIGFILALFFQILMWIAIQTMGKSWRIGIDYNNPDKLITHGIFKISRNPIFLS